MHWGEGEVKRDVKLVLWKGKCIHLWSCFFVVSCGQNDTNLDEIALEKYTGKSLLAPSCNDLKDVEYDGSWDPSAKQFTGFLKTCKNGKVYDYCEFVNGKRNGECLTYDEAGLLMGITQYRNGKKNCDFIQFD